MKKTLLAFIIVGLMFILPSCKRTDVTDPPWDGPAGFYVLLEGSASPAVLLIDGNIHISRIHVRVTDSKGNPLPGETVFIEQLADSTSHTQIDWGYFENNLKTIEKATNANGEVNVNYYGPVQWRSSAMWIHALLVVDGRAYRGSTSHIGNVPQDFIAMTLIDSGTAGATPSGK
jgi:hypothetical protein